MSDPIDRQAAIDAIFGRSHDIIKSRLKNLPSVQPEIIRCRDCKYSDENWRRVSVKWLPCMDIRVPSNWFCGSAERRTDDEG